MPHSTLDQIETEWENDSKVDITEPSREIAKFSKLHAKYQRYLNEHKNKALELTVKYKELERFKRDYYSGDLNNPEDLAAHGLEPFSKKLLRNDLNSWIQSDKDIIELSLEIEKHKLIVDACESIMKSIHSKDYSLKAVISWEMFVGGQR